MACVSVGSGLCLLRYEVMWIQAEAVFKLFSDLFALQSVQYDHY